MPGRHSFTSRPLLLCVALWGVVGVGCQLWTVGATQHFAAKSPLHPMMAPKEAIDLEVYFVDRHIGDPLIGEGLWNSLFAVTAVDPSQRGTLSTDGFRFAMSPAQPPRSLQSLMEISKRPSPYCRAILQKYTVPTGQNTWLVASEVPNGTPLTRRSGESVQTVELNNGKCLLHIQVDRIEDGWAKIAIIPEIRHGDVQLTPEPLDQGWVYREGQKVLTFHEDRLSADVNKGEILVLGLDPQSPSSLASHFFRSDVSLGVERLILIRVADLRRVDPVRVEAQ